jgi:hypothetical protein
MTVISSAGVQYLDLPRIGWRVISGTATASGSASGYDPDRAQGQQTYDGWRPDDIPARWMLDAGSSVTADYMGIGAHDLAGCTIQPERWNGSAWVAIAPTRLIADNSAILWLFPAVAATRFALRITDGPVSMPTIGHIRFGQALVVPRPATYTGDPLDEGERIVLRQNISETGEYLGAVVEGNGLQFSMSVDHLSEHFRQGEWRLFRRWAESGNTFFVAPKPGAYPKEVAYAWLGGLAAVRRQIPKAEISGSVTLDCTGYAAP